MRLLLLVAVLAVAHGAELFDSSYVVLLDRDADSGTLQMLGSIGTRSDAHNHMFSVQSASSGVPMEQLQSMPGVRAVSENLRVSYKQAPHHLDRCDQCFLPLDGQWTAGIAAPGQGIHIYVVDTGVDHSHPLFGGRVANFFTAFSSFDDRDGHGTHVAGIAAAEQYGVAPNARVYNVRVLDETGSGSTMTLASGLSAVLAGGARPGVINLSLGYYGVSTVIDLIIKDLLETGFSVTAAAGNDATNACSHNPSSIEGVLSVATINSADTAALFTNYGTCVDLFAVGVAVESLAVGGGTSRLSGTSMSSPVVAGLAALTLQHNPGWSHTQVAASLIQNAAPGSVIGARGSPNRIATRFLSLTCGGGGSTTSSSSSSSTTSSDSWRIHLTFWSMLIVAVGVIA